MADHRHPCPECGRYIYPTRCSDAGCVLDLDRPPFANVLCYVPRLCPRHARAAWTRVCEIVSACVIAACVEDAIDAATDEDVSASVFWERYAAVAGWTRREWEEATGRARAASVEAMREGERKP